eukprot:Hpha_TRINITY_DN10351_c0_g2::TRINITY_DN10351_c0_g2_i1::g.116174::m.116174/K14810/DDX56, DBP9; ATP-dependent RNA helicase DDX56/DBP9
MSLASLVVKDRPGRSFGRFGLDPRLLQGIQDLGFKEPTLIQASTIPLALAGKDVLARAGTGSGKTGAYAIPVCERFLATSKKSSSPRVLVVVPSRELCHQTAEVFTALLGHSGFDVRIVDVSAVDASAWAGGKPDIVIGTPSTLLTHLKQGSFSLDEVHSCVVDEADALLGRPIMKRLRCLYPTTAQTYLMSATLSPGVLELKRLLLNHPVVVKLEHEDEEEGAGTDAGPSGRVDQSYVVCSDDGDRYCFLWALVRLGYVPGRVLVFVDSVLKAYKVQMFLERFGVAAAVLNHDVPVNSRNHIVSQFNTGHFSFLIATDESVRVAEAEARAAAQPQAKKKLKRKRGEEDAATSAGAAGRESEYGVSRGIDFREVAAVISFDSFGLLEETACKSYIHRIGRTGRAGREGLAVSFIGRGEAQEGGWIEYLNEYLSTRGQKVSPHPVNGTEREKAFALKYRTDDVLHSIKKRAVKQARLKELAQEALASEKLQQHFSSNPNDLVALRHIAQAGGKKKVRADALAYIPEYLGVGVQGGMEEAQTEQPADPPLKRKRRRGAPDPLEVSETAHKRKRAGAAKADPEPEAPPASPKKKKMSAARRALLMRKLRGK